MKYLIMLMLLVGCSTQKPIPRQYVSLPPFPQSHTDYRYFIRIPPYTSAVIIRWYYEREEVSRMVYFSGLFNTQTQTIETDMYFYRPGYWILIYYCQTPSGLKQYKQTYNVRLNPIYE